MTKQDPVSFLTDIIDNIEYTQEALVLYNMENSRAQSYVSNADGCLDDALMNLHNAIGELELNDE